MRVGRKPRRGTKPGFWPGSVGRSDHLWGAVGAISVNRLPDNGERAGANALCQVADSSQNVQTVSVAAEELSASLAEVSGPTSDFRRFDRHVHLLWHIQELGGAFVRNLHLSQLGEVKYGMRMREPSIGQQSRRHVFDRQHLVDIAGIGGAARHSAQRGDTAGPGRGRHAA